MTIAKTKERLRTIPCVISSIGYAGNPRIAIEKFGVFSFVSKNFGHSLTCVPQHMIIVSKTPTDIAVSIREQKNAEMMYKITLTTFCVSVVHTEVCTA